MRQPLLPSVVILILLVLGSGLLTAQEWFVDPGATSSGNGSSQTPWVSLAAAVGHTSVSAGDTINLRPGIYQSQARHEIYLTKARLTLRPDPSRSGRVIIDGGVLSQDLRNRDAEGKQKRIANYGQTKRVLQITANDVTIIGLEVRNGYVGIYSNAANTRILKCHVHNMAQSAISLSGEGAEIASCIVHDVALYNIDGQCLAKDDPTDRDKRKKVYRDDGSMMTNSDGSPKNMDWPVAIRVNGTYPQDTKKKLSELNISRKARVHDNLLWNAWCEGFGSYFSEDALFVNNTAFNTWRIGYYPQNADGAVLDGNLIFYRHHGFDEWANRDGIIFNNERPRDYLVSRHGTNNLLPDTSGLVLRGNIILGAKSGISSPTWDNPKQLNTQTDKTVTIRGNLIGFLENSASGAPTSGIHIGTHVRGITRVEWNLLVSSRAEVSDWRSIFAAADTTRTVRIEDNNRTLSHTTEPALADLTGLQDAVLTKAKAVENLARDVSGPRDTGTALRELQDAVGKLRAPLVGLLRDRQSTPPNSAPRIVSTAANPPVVTLP